jgi:hypothetical protein
MALSSSRSGDPDLWIPGIREHLRCRLRQGSFANPRKIRDDLIDVPIEMGCREFESGGATGGHGASRLFAERETPSPSGTPGLVGAAGAGIRPERYSRNVTWRPRLGGTARCSKTGSGHRGLRSTAPRRHDPWNANPGPKERGNPKNGFEELRRLIEQSIAIGFDVCNGWFEIQKSVA